MEALRDDDPRRLGGYRVLRRLGSGGMGRVYLAQSPGMRQVALKAVHAHLARDPEFRSRFAREVEVARQVSGVYTASVLDADTGAPTPWLATEYLPGPTLSAAVREKGPVRDPELRMLTAALAEALHAIHEARLVHRDFKPGNIILTAEGPRVIDFGIAKALDAAAATHTGSGFGTPAYLAPEQAEGGEVTAKSDVFALGAVLAFASTGTAPFGTQPAATVLYRVVHGRPALDAVPASLRGIVGACLDKDPDRRPEARDVLRIAGGSPGGPTRWSPDGSIAALISDREHATLVSVREATGRTPRGRARRLVRHPAAWGGGLLAAAAAGVAGTVLLAGTGSGVLDAEEADPAAAVVLEPAARTPLALATEAGEGAVQAISLNGTAFVRADGDPEKPVETVDLDEPSADPEEDRVGADAEITSVAVRDGGGVWGAALDDGTVRVREDGEETRIGESFADYTALAFGAADSEYAVGRTAAAHELHSGWQMATGRRQVTTGEHRGDGIRDPHTAPVTAVAVSRDGEHVASAADGLTIGLDSGGNGSTNLVATQVGLDLDDIRAAETGQMEEAPDGTAAAKGEMTDDKKAVTAIAVGPGGAAVAFGLGEMAYLWATDTGKAVPLPRASGDGAIDAVAFSPDGELVAASGAKGAVNIWRAATGARIASMVKPEGSAPLAFTADGTALRAVDSEDVLTEWRTEDL